jgi:hypothetical protein
MERWLLLRLDAAGIAAEALVNGVPVARVGATGGRAVVAVHEYTISGNNRLTLVIAPQLFATQLPPEPRIAMAAMQARLQLALVLEGQAVNDPNARLLASKEWLPADGDAFDAPLALDHEVPLPVTFPRWRWLDAPPVADNPAMQRLALEFVQRLAADFARGDAERYLSAARLRFDELALAYRRSAVDLVQQFRDRLQAMYAAKSLVIAPSGAADMRLRRVAEGRLVECVGPTGEPALRSAAPDGASSVWPLRLTVVENRIYVLR